MKKTILTILICGVMIIGMTGCGSKEENNKETKKNNNDYVLFRCGEGNPNISVKYDEFKMKGNDILEFTSYEEAKYESKEKMESKYDFYSNLGLYDVKKISDTELKIIKLEPTNIYSMIEIENGYKEIIEKEEESGRFCQISEDGETFPKAENNNQSYKDQERNAWDSSKYDLGSNYDSEVFYVKNADINFKMIDGFKTEEKNASKKSISESFKTGNIENEVYSIDVIAEDSEYYAYAKDGHKKGAESEAYSKRKFDLDYSEKNQASEIKTTKIGNYDVYYYNVIDYVISNSPSVATKMFFDISDEYCITIVINYSSKIKYDDIKNNDISSYKDLISSFKITNIN